MFMWRMILVFDFILSGEYHLRLPWSFPGGLDGKDLPAMWKTWVWSPGQEDPLEKSMAIHSSSFAWRILWAEEPDGLRSMGSCWEGEKPTKGPQKLQSEQWEENQEKAIPQDESFWRGWLLRSEIGCGDHWQSWCQGFSGRWVWWSDKNVQERGGFLKEISHPGEQRNGPVTGRQRHIFTQDVRYISTRLHTHGNDLAESKPWEDTS